MCEGIIFVIGEEMNLYKRRIVVCFGNIRINEQFNFSYIRYACLCVCVSGKTFHFLLNLNVRGTESLKKKL